jgi:hypothetical protein
LPAHGLIFRTQSNCGIQRARMSNAGVCSNVVRARHKYCH